MGKKLRSVVIDPAPEDVLVDPEGNRVEVTKREHHRVFFHATSSTKKVSMHNVSLVTWQNWATKFEVKKRAQDPGCCDVVAFGISTTCPCGQKIDTNVHVFGIQLRCEVCCEAKTHKGSSK